MIRESYLANLKREQISLDKCIIVCRGRGNDELAPSAELLHQFMAQKSALEKVYGKRNAIAHNRAWDMCCYELRFKSEIYSNPKALKRLKEIAKKSLKEDVYLVCYEKSPKKCHRFLLMEFIMDSYCRGVK